MIKGTAIVTGVGRGSVAADVTDRAAVTRVVEEAERQLGPIALLVNNAGVPGPFGPLRAVNPDEWWASLAVHIRAPLLVLRAGSDLRP